MITVEVKIVSQGEYKPERVFDALQPATIELLFEDGDFMIHKLSFVKYTNACEIALLRACRDHKISDYVSTNVSRT